MSSISNGIIQLPGFPILLCVSVMLALSLVLGRFRRRAASAPCTSSYDTSSNPKPEGYPPVERLPDFDWKTKEPLKIRPFKPKYNMTMSMYTGGKGTLLR